MAENPSTRGGEWPGSAPAPGEEFCSPGMPCAIKEKTSGFDGGAGELLDDAKAKVLEWKDEIADAASSIKQSAQDAASVVVEKGQNLEHELAAFIRRYPVPCMMAGFGLGLLSSRATRR